MKNYKWKQIPYLLKRQSGRRRLWNSLLYRLRRIIIPIAFFYRRTIIRHVKIVTVVGSFGKTTTARAVVAALGLSPEKVSGQNNNVFLAAGLLNIRPWSRYGVLEVGISRKGQMAYNAKLIKPDIVIVTAIGSEHNSSLGDLDTTREEKAMMVRALPTKGLVVLNGDDPHVLKMREYTRAKAVTCGYGESNDYRVEFVGADLAGGSVFKMKTGSECLAVKTGLFSRAAVRSLVAAIIVADRLGVDRNRAFKALESLRAARERNELMKTPEGIYILLDTLKSAEETVHLALETLEDLPAKRKILILGEVEEPMGSLGEKYRSIGARLADVVDQVVFIGSRRTKTPLFSAARHAGIACDHLHYAGNSVYRAIECVIDLSRPGDLVMIKGRSTQKLLRIALALQGKPVLCYREFCKIKASCLHCKMLVDGTENKVTVTMQADPANDQSSSEDGDRNTGALDWLT